MNDETLSRVQRLLAEHDRGHVTRIYLADALAELLREVTAEQMKRMAEAQALVRIQALAGELRVIGAGAAHPRAKLGATGSPNHRHQVAGVWDADNGQLAGLPCAECAIFDLARELIARAGQEAPTC